MPVAELIQFLAPTLADHDLSLEAVSNDAICRAAQHSIVYRGKDCKVQKCWSARDGASDTEITSWLRDLSLEHFDSGRSTLRPEDCPIAAEVPP